MIINKPISERLRKHSIHQVQDNLEAGQGIDCGHALFEVFEQELQRHYFIEGDEDAAAGTTAK